MKAVRGLNPVKLLFTLLNPYDNLWPLRKTHTHKHMHIFMYTVRHTQKILTLWLIKSGEWWVYLNLYQNYRWFLGSTYLCIISHLTIFLCAFLLMHMPCWLLELLTSWWIIDVLLRVEHLTLITCLQVHKWVTTKIQANFDNGTMWKSIRH